MDALLVIVTATVFGYGVVWLIGREPLTTADVAVGVLAGFAGLALAGSLMGGSLDGAVLMACMGALVLQSLRGRSVLERVE